MLWVYRNCAVLVLFSSWRYQEIKKNLHIRVLRARRCGKGQRGNKKRTPFLVPQKSKKEIVVFFQKGDNMLKLYIGYMW